jgi:hypothetical protein
MAFSMNSGCSRASPISSVQNFTEASLPDLIGESGSLRAVERPSISGLSPDNDKLFMEQDTILDPTTMGGVSQSAG